MGLWKAVEFDNRVNNPPWKQLYANNWNHVESYYLKWCTIKYKNTCVILHSENMSVCVLIKYLISLYTLEIIIYLLFADSPVYSRRRVKNTRSELHCMYRSKEIDEWNESSHVMYSSWRESFRWVLQIRSVRQCFIFFFINPFFSTY